MYLYLLLFSLSFFLFFYVQYGTQNRRESLVSEVDLFITRVHLSSRQQQKVGNPDDEFHVFHADCVQFI